MTEITAHLNILGYNWDITNKGDYTMTTQRYFHTNFPKVALKCDNLKVRYTRHATERMNQKNIPQIKQFDGKANKLVEIDVQNGEVVKYLYEVETTDTIYSYAMIHCGNYWLVKTVWSNYIGEHNDANRNWNAYTFGRYLLCQQTKQLKKRV